MSSPARPESVCLNCWRVWAAGRPPLAVGYCPHTGVGWRLVRGREVALLPMTREEYRAALAVREAREESGL